jgi:hypothetical protein
LQTGSYGRTPTGETFPSPGVAYGRTAALATIGSLSGGKVMVEDRRVEGMTVKMT